MLATVAVPGPVRRLFSYTVPPALAARSVPGVRVLVPFGRRRVTAYLVGLSDTPPPGDAPSALKPIEEVLDDAPSLDGDILALTRWAADYYAASWGDIIRAALPGLVAPTRLEVAVTEAGALALAGGRAGRTAGPILEAILRSTGAAGRALPVADCRRRTGEALPIDRLRVLARRGLLVLHEVVTAAGPPERQETWVLPPEAVPGAHEEARPPRRRTGARQAAVLKQVRAAPGGVRLAEILASTGAGHAAVRALAARGQLRLETRAAPRTPVALEARPAAPPRTHDLTAEQASAVESITAALGSGQFATFLLFGVTGSGKTEVYLRGIEAALAGGRRALYLVPEIGLTPLLARRMQARFGDTLALLHSGLSDGERQAQWRRVREGRIRVVLGARSAVFAPLADPGLVVVDEEHDASYKQDEHPRYHGRDLAVLRASQAGAVAILGSATPSMESYHHALESKYRLLTLTGRPGGAALPPVHRVDMRREFEEVGRETILSRRLLDALRERLERGEQSIVLLNRRGFSTFVLCRTCGKPIECDACSIAMTLHLRERRLRCHYCNAQRAIPAVCPACGSGHLHFGGTGTERLEETLASLLPRARIARMDRDTVRGRGSVEALLDRVERGEVDILMGTQMVAKGHDFPNVTLVGVLAADALLGMPDFRAGERTFQLLAQVAGRSGRRERAGEVIVQAWDPGHHAVRAACEHDFESFARDELAYRRTLQYPPFAALALLVFRDRDYEVARTRAANLAGGLRRLGLPGVKVLGPAPAPLERLRGTFRVQVMIKGDTRAAVRHGMGEAAALLERAGLRPDGVTIDVDPVSTL